MATFSIRALAAVLLLFALWKLFRFAMALRFAKVLREEESTAHEKSGRRLVAEVPSHGGDLVLFLEDAESFWYGEHEFGKREIAAVRLILNGRVVDRRMRPGTVPPDAVWSEEYDGRERWDVRLDLDGGEPFLIPCGMLREGVSRDAAARLFRALAAAVDAAHSTQSSSGRPSSG